MATKKKRPRVARAKSDAMLKDALVSALQRDAANELKQTQMLRLLLDEVHTLRLVLEHEVSKYNLPAVKAKRRKGRSIK